MHRVVEESGAQVYPKRSLTNLPQPNTGAFHGLSSKVCMPQGTQRARGALVTLADTVGMCTHTAATSDHESA